jgi:Protein tyrosine and serine/threonine kinase
MDEGGTAGLGGRGTAARGRPGLRLRMAFVLDVVGYGTRTVPQQQDAQRRLRALIDVMLDECGLKLEQEIVDHQWTGDGINAVLPADIDPTAALPVLMRSMASALGADNAQSDDRIRMRMAVSVGLIERSVAGFSGPLIVDINRLVDSAPLRAALAETPAADLAVAISEHVYAMMIAPGYPGIPGGQLTQVAVVAKEFSGTAWLWLSARQWSSPAYLPLSSADPGQVGGYRIFARLGASAGGVVYLGGSAGFGTDVASGGAGGAGGGTGGDWSEAGWVAVKVFDQALDTDARRRLAAGALAAGVLPDPHLASVLASDTVAARPWVASTLVRGPSLADTVTQTGPLPPAAVGWTALGLARAVATLHQAGLTHRAITPRNVLLDGHGPMLTDFGVNRAALAFGPGSCAEDVFLLGWTICYAATGRAPWPDLPADPMPPAAATAPPGAIDLTGCPAGLAQIARWCLAADQARRPTADRLVRELAELAGRRPASWLPDPVAGRLRDYQELPPPRPAAWPPRFRWAR